MRPYQELIYVQNCLESVDLLPHLFSRYSCSHLTFSCACDRLRFSFQDIFVLHLSFTRLCQDEGGGGHGLYMLPAAVQCGPR